MAPAKRKRNERVSVDGGENRPSPHRPQNTNLGQHDRGQDMRDGGRRSSRGGQGGLGGRGGRRNDSRDNPNKLNINPAVRSTPGPMSPPPPRPSSATQTPTSTAELSSPVPKLDLAPFDYTFLTDNRMASWDDTGRQEVVQLGTQARQDEDPMDLASVFQELIRATLDGRLDPTDAGSCVKEILGLDVPSANGTAAMFDPSTFFLDTLSMIVEADHPQNTPTNPSLRPFIASTGISPMVMRQVLDGRLLQDTGLTRDTFNRVGVRQATNLLYRQANYNLLREETEGYSKLVTELFTTSGSEPPSAEVVEDTFERVKGLIGTFDLDVGRVLDITLDVFAAVLIKHYRFFIKLLRVSSWWPRIGEGDLVAASAGLPVWALPSSPGWAPTEEEDDLSRQQREARDMLFWPRAREIGLDAFFELGGRQIVDDETKSRILEAGEDVDLDADRQWIKETGTYPPSGNRVAAQLLGFKLRFYASDIRDKEDSLPHNLIYLTALLIKIGFISLRDIYPHIWPTDEEMPAQIEKRKAELAEKEKLNRPGGGAANALTMAGALPDDSLPNNGRGREVAVAKADTASKPAPETAEDDELGEPTDQKVLLLTCLLTIGAIPESLFILGRFPTLTEAHPELLDLVNRILNHAIKDVYAASRPIAEQGAEFPTKMISDPDQNGVPKGQVRLVQLQTRKQLRWPFPDKYDNDNMSYRFYWDEWADNVPVCQSVDDVFTLCDTLLAISGVSIGKDAQLLSRLARIGTKSLAEDRSQGNLDRWQDLLKRLLVPALSLNKANTEVVNEVFSMLKFYPTSTRYAIYADWFEGRVTPQLPPMKIAFERARLETLSTMKRISGINAQSMARTLSKTATACPGIVFKVALTQIESYNNLTKVVVECAKYFSDLGYDVLVWSLMNALGGHKRSRNNAEFALLPSRWLLALSKFTGEVFKRYRIMDLAPIIQYVNDQLYRGNSTDLVILKELISEMAGIVPDTDFSDKELLAMSGGSVLRKQTLIGLKDRRFESIRTGDRLMRALVETNLAGELLISIAQFRQSAIYRISDEDAHIKMLATMIDDTQSTLAQYLDLLRSNLAIEDFDKQVPGIPELIADFGLAPALAFMIGRASLANRISKVTPPAPNGTLKSLAASAGSGPVTVDADGDVGMDGGADAAQPTGEATPSQPTATNGHAEVKEDTPMADLKSQSPPLTPSSTDPFEEILEPIITGVLTSLPKEAFEFISADFYVTFWTATLGDLSIPSSSYDAEISRLLNEQSLVMKDRTDMTRAGMSLKESKKEALSQTREALMGEFGKFVGSFGRTKARLLRHKSDWFKPRKADAVSDAMLEKCLIPRILLSPSDADFCFKMIKFLHDNGVPHFRLLSFYAHLFRANRLRSIIFTCTIREAENMGRFLRLVLADLDRWHNSATVYEKEAWGVSANLPGFAKALDEEGKPKGLMSYDGNKGFKWFHFTWHQQMYNALRQCLEGVEWMHIRNAITILKSVVEVYPTVDFMGNQIIKQLEVVAKREKGVREDLSLTGNAVLVQMKKRSKSWIMVQAFGHNTIVDKGQTNGNTPGSNTHTSGSALKSGLKPTAPEFKPQSRSSSRGVTPKPLTTTEVEDGEVDDARTAVSASAAKATVISNAEARSTPPATSIPESRKSDVLKDRENFKRNNAARASPPRDPTIPPRPEPSRPPFVERPGPNLPSRPDPSFQSRDILDRHPPRHSDRRDGRDGRDLRLPDVRGLDRPSGRLGDRPGDRPRDFSGSDRRNMDINPRDAFSLSDRSSRNDRDRLRPEPPPRWTADSARDSMDRASSNSTRGVETGRLSRDMPPPRISGGLSERGPPVNADRLPPISSERQEAIIPERTALMSGDKDITRSDSPRRGRDEPRDRASSRPQSPRRHGSEKDHSETRRDERSLRNGAPESFNSSRSRSDDVQPPPAGPRSDRPLDRMNERTSNDRSAFQPTQSSSRSIDQSHGRLISTPRQQEEPTFGRLKSALTPPSTANPDIPSGPRDRNMRTGRAPPSARQDRRVDMPRPPTPEKQPPTGPSSRNPRRSASGQFDQISASQGSAQSTPGAASSGPGIHPDRLKQLGSVVATPSPAPTPAPAATTPLVHPDRLRAIESPVMPPPAIQQNNIRGRPPLPPVTTALPPSGPKGSQPSPGGGLGTNGFAAPTGPASATERAARGGRRQLAGINTMLQQAGQQNAPDRNMRNRGRMPSGMGPETPIASPSIPAPPPPPPGAPPGRFDAAREPARADVNPDRPDLITGGALAPEERERERSGRRDRSGHQSRRSSRSPGRERDSKRGAAPEEDRSRSDYRRDPERDRHAPRSPTRDLIAGRDVGSSRESGRESGRDRDRDRDGSRRDGRERDATREQPNEAGWTGERGSERGADRGSERGSGRSREMRGDMRGEERRDSRSMREDGGRKRHSEEGGGDARGREKRPRR